LAAETIVITSPTAQAYAELQAAFDHYNRELFGGELPHCLITMQREKRTYGYFSSERFVHRHDRSKTDEIAINPSVQSPPSMLKLHDFCNRAGETSTWKSPMCHGVIAAFLLARSPSWKSLRRPTPW